MNTHDKIELPPLPDLPCYRADLFDPEVRVVEASLVETLLQQYARAAIEADCKWLEAAARTVAELAAIIPVSDILGATATCQDMIDYFKRLIADRKRRGEPVAYLDLGVGGYMDLGTDLTDEQLAALPKGRHMLAIVGTYGVDGYTEADPQSAEPVDKSKNLQGSVVDKAEEMQSQTTASAEPFGHVWRASDTTAVIKLVGDPRIIDGIPVYAAPVAAQPSVLDGWKLVPEEPTMEMLYAARKADKEYQARMGLPDTIGVGAYDHYVAMLEAAPVVAQPSAEPTSSD